MSSLEEDHRIGRWNSTYYQDISSHPSNYIMRRGVIDDLTRYRDEMIERLYSTRASITVDGTFTIEPKEECDKFIEEEDEEEEFLFDPNDLDV